MSSSPSAFASDGCHVLCILFPGQPATMRLDGVIIRSWGMILALAVVELCEGPCMPQCFVLTPGSLILSALLYVHVEFSVALSYSHLKCTELREAFFKLIFLGFF